MALLEGSKFPEGITFQYIPIDISNVSELNPLKCEIPIKLDMDKLLESLSNQPDRYILIVSISGAYTPTCGSEHVPKFLRSLHQLKAKEVGALIVISNNDPFVISSWGKLLLKEHLHDTKDIPQLIFAYDVNLSSKNGLTNDSSGFVRNSRYATLIDSKTRKIVYLGVETERKVSVSGYEAVAARL
ncbi:uncharacterized protein KGF55_005029 [Candida pseudojiufengensis]|uniref:uncharacterized protein n=1 Tax=Candida pseudojiufengensis TaxID=497109 RepID=UPI0022241BAA|nr:uncharacterized protein KGF55_005029 [Candida pseudojiufengensis]KAI5959797.1 hypothetical protein KGF55_005029 [Candida pseudojiufengensis]